MGKPAGWRDWSPDMAQAATDVLSLAAARVQLLLDPLDDAASQALVDAQVLSAIGSAVAYVADRTGYPLIDSTAEFETRPTSLDDRGVIALPVRDVTAVRSVTYYAAGDRVVGPRSGNIDPLPHQYHERAGWTLLSAPPQHWPGGPGSVLPAELDPSLPWSVTVSKGYNLASPLDEDIRQAVIIMTRHFFEQPDYIESGFSVLWMIDGIRARRGIRAPRPPV